LTLHRRAQGYDEDWKRKKHASQLEPEPFDPDVSMLEPERWPVHESLLAEHLGGDAWSAISDAYDAIEDIRHRALDAEYQPEWGMTASGPIALAHIVNGWGHFFQHALAKMPDALRWLDRMAEVPQVVARKGNTDG
jgi:hypothetical protein